MSDFDHIAEAKGQQVHCERAAFFAVAFPLNAWGRFQLGFWLSAGAVAGGVSMVALIIAVSKLLSAVFT